MGYDASCVLKVDGRSVIGTAWLEHTDLVFRGPERLVIPLASVKSATADGEVLRVRFGSRTAEFRIGPVATKWADRITNPPSRLDKLGVKPGMSVAVLGLRAPDFLADLERRGAVVSQPSPAATSRLRDVDVVFFGTTEAAALGRLASLRAIIRPEGAIWVVRPKGQKSISEAATMAAGKRAGLVDVKVVSFSETQTAEKFVIPVASRPTSARRQPPAGRSRRR